MAAYYNEIDTYAAQWLRNLIKAGHIADGVVDERSIEDVTPDDIREFTQCHFFAGIGVWSLALRNAGWPDDKQVWTGSCPCQPFSTAGKGAGFADERHLWPAFHHLIRERRPGVVFGEQVASKDADAWIDLVHTDMEAVDYRFWATPFPSASLGAPHIRDRMYWVADSNQLVGRQGSSYVRGRVDGSDAQPRAGLGGGSLSGGMANPDSDGFQPGSEGRSAMGYGQATGPDCGAGGMEHPQGGRWTGQSIRTTKRGQEVGAAQGGDLGGLADDDQERRGRRQGLPAWRLDDGKDARRVEGDDGLVGSDEAGVPRIGSAGPTNGIWRAADWLLCRDGKWRPVEPGTFPLAHGAPARVGRLRAYGNAINAEQAKEFIGAYLGAH